MNNCSQYTFPPEEKKNKLDSKDRYLFIIIIINNYNNNDICLSSNCTISGPVLWSNVVFIIAVLVI